MSNIQKIIDETRDGYNAVALQFTETRTKHWSDAELFAESIPYKGKVLDVGCGSGRFSPYVLRASSQYVGIDMSDRIIEQARNQYALDGAEFVSAEMSEIPCKDTYFDAVFCLAALHHIPSDELRTVVMSEMFRVLKRGGVCCISVWNVESKVMRKKYTPDEHNDVIIPWKNRQGELLWNRFIHSFTREELVRIAKHVGFSVKKCHYIRNGKRSTKESGTNLYLHAVKV